MQIYLFWSQADTKVFGFTLDIHGANLPVEFGPWSKNDGGEALFSCPRDHSAGVGLSNVVVQTVQRDGFYLGQTGRTASLSASPQRSGCDLLQ